MILALVLATVIVLSAVIAWSVSDNGESQGAPRDYGTAR
jgi:hypothetical protein